MTAMHGGNQTATPRNTILVGDALDRLRQLPAACVDAVVTSPPYFGLRDYGASGQLGSETTVEAWVAGLARVCDQVARVLVPSGGLWLNLGDSYSRHARYGAPPKGLLLAPERLLLALTERGWMVRNKVIWSKTNPMPSSVGDRLNTTYDVVYFLVRSSRYYFDLDAIREPHTSGGGRAARTKPEAVPAWAGALAGKQDGLRAGRVAGVPGHLAGKNPGDVWRLAGSHYRGAHFATFPEALITWPILASCPERRCVDCQTPWRRPARILVLGRRSPVVRRGNVPTGDLVRRYATTWRTMRQVGALEPGCSCRADFRAGVVLDPFVGTGTVAVVAERLGRDWLGIELNPDYAGLAWRRIRQARSDVAA